MEWLGWEELTKLILGNYETWKVALTFAATLLKPSVCQCKAQDPREVLGTLEGRTENSQPWGMGHLPPPTFVPGLSGQPGWSADPQIVSPSLCSGCPCPQPGMSFFPPPPSEPC